MESCCHYLMRLTASRSLASKNEYIVGGELQYGDDGSLTYFAADLEGAIRWVESERFKPTPELVQELRQAVEGSAST